MAGLPATSAAAALPTQAGVGDKHAASAITHAAGSSVASSTQVSNTIAGPTLVHILQVDLSNQTAKILTPNGSTLNAQIDNADTTRWISTQNRILLVPQETGANRTLLTVQPEPVPGQPQQSNIQHHITAQNIFLATGAQLSPNNIRMAINDATQQSMQTAKAGVKTGMHPGQRQASQLHLPTVQAHATLHAKNLPITPALVQFATPATATSSGLGNATHDFAATSSTGKSASGHNLQLIPTGQQQPLVTSNASQQTIARNTVPAQQTYVMQPLTASLPTLPNSPALTPLPTEYGNRVTTLNLPAPSPSTAPPPSDLVANLINQLQKIIGSTNSKPIQTADAKTAPSEARPIPDFLRIHQENPGTPSLREWGQANLMPQPGWQDYQLALPLFLPDMNQQPTQKGWIGIGQHEMGHGDGHVVFVRCDIDMAATGPTSIRLAVPESGPGSGTLVVPSEHAHPEHWQEAFTAIAESTGIHLRVRPWHPHERQEPPPQGSE